MRLRGRAQWWVLGGLGALVVGIAVLALAVAQLSSTPERTTANTYRALPDASGRADGAGAAAARATTRDGSGEDASSAGDGADTGAGGASAAPALLAAVDRIRIARIGVDAPVVTLGLNEQGDMDAPDGPEAVGWYEFTGKPGLPQGNAVLSGHVDWRGHGPAVFAQLGSLEPGDVVEIALVDGNTLHYRVTASRSYPVGQLDSRELIAPTVQPSLTLITCEGSFSNGEYTERRIVRAVLVDQAQQTAQQS